MVARPATIKACPWMCVFGGGGGGGGSVDMLCECVWRVVEMCHVSGTCACTMFVCV